MKIDSRKRKAFAVAPSNGAMAQQVRLCGGRFSAKTPVESKAALKASGVTMLAFRRRLSQPVRFRAGLPAISSAEAASAKEEAVVAKAGPVRRSCCSEGGSHSVAPIWRKPTQLSSLWSKLRFGQAQCPLIPAYSLIFPLIPAFPKTKGARILARSGRKSKKSVFFTRFFVGNCYCPIHCNPSGAVPVSCPVVLNRAKK
jgi:hypothetical protein